MRTRRANGRPATRVIFCLGGVHHRHQHPASSATGHHHILMNTALSSLFLFFLLFHQHPHLLLLLLLHFPTLRLAFLLLFHSLRLDHLLIPVRFCSGSSQQFSFAILFFFFYSSSSSSSSSSLVSCSWSCWRSCSSFCVPACSSTSPCLVLLSYILILFLIQLSDHMLHSRFVYRVSSNGKTRIIKIPQPLLLGDVFHSIFFNKNIEKLFLENFSKKFGRSPWPAETMPGFSPKKIWQIRLFLSIIPLHIWKRFS